MRESADELGDASIHNGINYRKICGKQKNGSNDNARGGANLRPAGPGHAPHFGLDFLYVSLCLFGPTYGLGCHFHADEKSFSFHTSAEQRTCGVGLKSGNLAGAEGFEPPKAVLETAGLPLAYAPNELASI